MNHIKKLSTGELIPFYSANFSTDKSSHCWTFNAEIADSENLNKLKPTKALRGDYVEVEFKLGTIVWRLIIEKTSERTTSNQFSVTGRSPSVFLTDNYSLPITKTWVSTTAYTIVTELCNHVGLNVLWLINDWAIADYIATDRYPIDIIKDLIGEKMAVILSLPDGTVVISPNLPCSPKNINKQPADFFVATDKNIFERGHEFDNRKNYNKVTVTKQSDSASDSAPSVSIEQSADGIDAIIKVRVNPMVPRVTLNHTSGSNVTVYYEGIKSETITDQLMITNGKATLSKPFASLQNVVWHQNNLGDLLINNRGEVSAANGFGLVTATYLSHYHQYRLQRLTSIDLTGFEIADISVLPDLSSLYIDLIMAGSTGNKPMPPVIVKTLPTQTDLLERARQELWQEMLDIDEYTIECAYENAPIFPAKIAQVKINRSLELFNTFVKSVSVSIGSTITQTVTLERPLS